MLPAPPFPEPEERGRLNTSLHMVDARREHTHMGLLPRFSRGLGRGLERLREAMEEFFAGCSRTDVIVA